MEDQDRALNQVRKSRPEISDCGTLIRPSIRDDQSELTINLGMPRDEQFDSFAKRAPRALQSFGKSDNAVEQNSTITNKLSNSTTAPHGLRLNPV